MPNRLRISRQTLILLIMLLALLGMIGYAFNKQQAVNELAGAHRPSNYHLWCAQPSIRFLSPITAL